MKYKAIKGMHDILPADSLIWQTIETTTLNHFNLYGYGEIRTPIVEDTALFVRGVGEGTDIVGKEMYSFIDKGDEALTLRPEGTAAVVRAVIEHNLVNVTSPELKVFYKGPMYRRERPQKGRLRQFHQIGAENFGSSSPLADAEMIAMVFSLLKKLGIINIRLLINSLGTRTERHAYQETLRQFLLPRQTEFCAECQNRIQKNPLRVLDCKNPTCQSLATGHPQILESLGAESAQHFEAVCSLLKNLEVPYTITPTMVRGLDYYEKTVFEFVSDDLGAQSTLAAGGRYDGLVEDLGGPAVPGIGFAMGVERLLIILNGKITTPASDKIFVACLGEQARVAGLKIISQLRTADLVAEMEYDDKSLKSQMRRADRTLASHVIVLGENELANQKVIVKNFRDKSQAEVGIANLVGYFKQ